MLILRLLLIYRPTIYIQHASRDPSFDPWNLRYLLQLFSYFLVPLSSSKTTTFSHVFLYIDQFILFLHIQDSAVTFVVVAALSPHMKTYKSIKLAQNTFTL
jgi:hypothetical protein